MKKTALLCLLLICCSLLLSACGTDYVAQAAKGADEYAIVAAYDETSHKLSAVQTVKVTNRCAECLNSVKFHVYANCYREDATRSVVPSSYQSAAFPHGESHGEISFDEVKVDGVAAAYVIEGEDLDILSVPVDELFPDETAVIEMTYEIALANAFHRLGYGDNTVNLGNFYPVLCLMENDAYKTTPYYCVGDPFVTDVANYDVTLTVPSALSVASSGSLLSSETSGECATYTYRAEVVRDFALVLGNFTVLENTVGDVAVRYCYFADEDAEATLATAVAAMQFFSEKIAPYPYKTLTVAEADFCYGGMEYPRLVMVASGGKEYTQSVVHEVAHQWFYGLVGNDQIEHAWMDEGLAEFLTLLFMDAKCDLPLSNSIGKLYKNYTTYVDVLTDWRGSVDTSYRALANYKNDAEYVYITYVKGAIMFYTLYDSVGADKFYKCLSRYFDQCKMTIASPSDMKDCFVRASGCDLSGIFDSFANGSEVIAEGGKE